MEIISYLTIIVMIALVAFSLKFISSTVMLLGVFIATILFAIGNLVKSKSARTFSAVSLLLLALIYFIEYMSDKVLTELVLAIVSLIFMIIVINKKVKRKAKKKKIQKLAQVYKPVEDKEEKVVTQAKEETKATVKAKVTKTAKVSEKFVASKTGKKYHVPTCDMVKRINDKNKILLKDSRSANRKGYKACDCVKKR